MSIIGINGTCLSDKPSGARQRFIGLYSCLFKEMIESQFVIFEPKGCSFAECFNNQPNISFKKTPLSSNGSHLTKVIEASLFWRSSLKFDRYDGFESLHLPAVQPAYTKSIVTIHDVRGLYDLLIPRRIVYAAALKLAISRADRVITVSQSMRDEIIGFYPQAKVVVIENGITASSYGRVSSEYLCMFRAKYRLPTEFILAVGHLESRKNYINLLNAIAILKNRGLNCPLVIIGNDNGEGIKIKREAHKLGLERLFFLLTGLSDQEVRAAYAGSLLFVFPSTYEGFGIPILEAMAARRAMALSDIKVFKEITQGKMIYFNPRCPESMANAIELGLTNTEMRIRMIEFGVKRMTYYDYPALAKRFKKIYTDLRLA